MVQESDRDIYIYISERELVIYIYIERDIYIYIKREIKREI